MKSAPLPSLLVLRLERLDPRARRVIVAAQTEADRQGCAHCTMEHVAVSLLGTAETARAAARADVDLEPHLSALRWRCSTLPAADEGGLSVLDPALLKGLGTLEQRIGDRVITLRDVALLLGEHALVPFSLVEHWREDVAGNTTRVPSSVWSTAGWFGRSVRRLIGTTATSRERGRAFLRDAARAIADQYVPGLVVERENDAVSVTRSGSSSTVVLSLTPSGDALVLAIREESGGDLRRFTLDVETLSFYAVEGGEELGEAFFRAIGEALYPEACATADTVRARLE
jgi:hypothetical protein